MGLVSITFHLNPTGNMIVAAYRRGDQTIERYFAPTELDALVLPSSTRTGADAMAAIIDFAGGLAALLSAESAAGPEDDSGSAEP